MQKNKSAAGEKSPDPLFYHLIMPLLKLYLFIRYGYRAPAAAEMPKDGPLVVLGSHASNLDFLFTVAAIYPHRPNALVTEYFFGEPALAWLLTSLHAIPRKQFVADTASVRAMLRTVRRGGCLLLYPEGEVNGTGRFDRMPPGIGKLCKLLGAPVYTAVTEGSYLSFPKWAKRQRRGKAFVRLELAADEAVLSRMTSAELDALLAEKLKYDDFEWQKRNMLPFRVKSPAEGLERMLYLCPKCGAEGRMESEGALLRCANCGNTAVLDEYGFLHKRGKDDIVFERAADWAEYQRKELRHAIASPDFFIEEKGALLIHKQGKLTGEEAGRGMIRLDAETLSYSGERYGESVCLKWPLKSFYKLSFGAGRDFGVPCEGKERIFLRPDRTQLVEKFVLAVNVLYDARALSDQQH